MSYEKKYKEALDRAKEWLNIKEPFSDTCTCVVESIFPELQESEDERIRKALIDLIYKIYANTSYITCDEHERMLAWLEKQGESVKSCWKPSKEQLEAFNHFVRSIGESGYASPYDNNTKLLYSLLRDLEQLEKQGQVKESAISQHDNTTCKENDDSLTSEDEKIRKDIIYFLSRNTFQFGEDIDKYKSWIAWIRKQGKQKHIEMKSAEESLGITSEEYNKIVDECIYGEQNVDKVKPKFEVGQWIINSEDTVAYINDVKKDIYGTLRYYIEFTTGTKSDPMPCFIDPEYHLWTINDAKAGDVLVNGSNIFIFHYINGTRLMGYCHVNTDDGKFYNDIGKNECFCLIDAVVIPATKEQRDLLFYKMKEEGYVWDEKKLELKRRIE